MGGGKLVVRRGGERMRKKFFISPPSYNSRIYSVKRFLNILFDNCYQISLQLLSKKILLVKLLAKKNKKMGFLLI